MRNLFSIKKIRVLALIICVAFLFSSCQKELEGSVFTFGCKVSQWADLDSTGKAVETFNYTYDSTTGKPIVLRYTDNISGGNQTVVPIFSKDTVYFNTGSYAALDNSKRIYRLQERNSVNPNAPDGIYYYTYDASGHIATRIYDNGTTAETTTYTFTGDELTKMNEPVFGTPNAITTTYTYAANIKIKDYNPFIFASAFPELRLYMPCFTYGRFTEKAIEKMTVKINLPFIPIPEITTSFSNYQFDAKGNMTKVQTDIVLPGAISTKDFLAGSYLCR